MNFEDRGNPRRLNIGGCVAAPVVSGARDEPELDPRFTEQQHRWIDAYIENGGKAREAALTAGYAEASAENMGIRNLAKPKLQAELVRRLRLRHGSLLATAVGGLLQVIEFGEDERARVQASLGLMDRFGMAPPRGPAVAIQVNNMNGNAAQQIIAEVHARRIQRLAQLEPAPEMDEEP